MKRPAPRETADESEFLASRPWEGLQYDDRDEGPTILRDSGDTSQRACLQASSRASHARRRRRRRRAPRQPPVLSPVTDEDEGVANRQDVREEVDAARCVARAARASGRDAVEALEAAEEALAAARPNMRGLRSQEFRGVVDAERQRCVPPGPQQTALQRARQQLEAAVANNTCLEAAGGTPQPAAVAALALCTAGNASAETFQVKVTNLVLALRKAGSWGALPQLQAEMAKARAASGAPADRPAHELRTLVETAAVAAASAESNANAVPRAVEAINAVAAAPVDTAALAAAGAGKTLRALRRHPQPAVAAAATAVLNNWKAALLAAPG
jgi:hypothetical protein